MKIYNTWDKGRKWLRNAFIEQQLCNECFNIFKELGKNSENIDGLFQIIYKQETEDSGHLQYL